MEQVFPELYTQGCRVWVPDTELVWKCTTVKTLFNKNDNVLQVTDDHGNDFDIKIEYLSQLPPLKNPDILLGANDLTCLSYLHEPAVLHNLRIRFLNQNAIYTWCGIVLVAVNPFSDLNIYGEETIQTYHQSMGNAQLDPHIYAVAEEAFTKLERESCNQSIIVSGESGAGKTVSAKFAMRYFASIAGSHTTNIENKVLASNPIMEAIGNAKTIRNDNSSRFGKYIQILFDPYSRGITGGNMSTYLLEKSRISFQGEGERNFHIFYQLCTYCRSNNLEKYKLKQDFKFEYLGNVEPTDNDKIKDFLAAMHTLGFNEKQQELIFRIVASILHAGNIKFKPIDDEQCTISDNDVHLQAFCELLGLDFNATKKWLTNRVIRSGMKEIIMTPMNIYFAQYARDALSKFIYEKMFLWIVSIINRVLGLLNEKNPSNTFIGVLDIYGFEHFETNSFEQFCINYANEVLQQQFNQHVFKLEQEEYVREDIDWKFITFTDNQPVINLIEAKPIGILNLLDEECRMPKGNDESWCAKLYSQLNVGQIFKKPKIGYNRSFIIQHFADKVTYQVSGFLEKNRDSVCEEQIDLLKRSALLGNLFSEEDTEVTQKIISGKLKITPQKNLKQFKFAKATVGSQFRESLANLMKILNSTTPHYVRCIKSNDSKAPFEFNNERVVQQLRACGVLETIRISSNGFPSRWTYFDFANRYRVLLVGIKKNNMNAKPNNSNETRKLVRSDISEVKKICDEIVRIVYELQVYSRFELPNEQNKETSSIYQFGKTKIFFRAGHVALLERIRTQRLRECAILLQKNIKGWLAKKRYLKTKNTILKLQIYSRKFLARKKYVRLKSNKAAITIQSNWKKYTQRKYYLKLKESVLRLQARSRGYLAREQLRMHKEIKAAICIQRHWKGYKAKQNYNKQLKQIITIQSLVRKWLAKRTFKHLRIEARSIDHVKTLNKGLESKIIQLQQKIEFLKTELNKSKQLSTANQDIKTEKARLANEIKVIKNVIICKNEEVEFFKSKAEQSETKNKELENTLNELRYNYEELKKKASDINTMYSKRALEVELAEKEKLIQAKYERECKILLEERESEKSVHQQLLRKYSALEEKLMHRGDMSDEFESRGPDISTVSLMMRCSELEQEKAKLRHENQEMRNAFANVIGNNEIDSPANILAQQCAVLQSELDKAREERTQLKTIILGQESCLKEPMAESEVISAFKSIVKQMEREIDAQKDINKRLQEELDALKKDNDKQQQIIGLNQQNLSVNSNEDHVMKLNQEKILLKQKCHQLTEENNKLRLEVLRRNVVGVGNENYYVGESKESKNNKYLGMFEFSQQNTSLITKILISDLEPDVALKFPAHYPAYIMYMCIRYTDYINEESQVKMLLNDIIASLRRRARLNNNVEVLSLWLSNVCALITCLKQYSGDEYYGVFEESLKSFDLSEYRQIFTDITVWIYHGFLRQSEERIQPLIVPAILEFEGLASSGIYSQPSNLQRSGSISNEQDCMKNTFHDKPVDAMIKELSELYKILLLHANQPEIIFQIFKQLFFFICAGALNNLLLRKDLCHWNKAMQIRFNLSALEQWCREQQIPNCNEIIDKLDPITQATKLLQTKKSEDNIPTIVEMCNKLSSSQIMKILNLYTAGDEETISPAFIKNIQNYIKQHRKDETNKSTLLIDTKYAFPLTIPYKPCDVKLQNVTLPPVLLKQGLGTVMKRL